MALRRDREKENFVMDFVQAPRIIKTFSGGHEESSAFLEEMDLKFYFTHKNRRRSSRVRYVAVRRPSFASYF